MTADQVPCPRADDPQPAGRNLVHTGFMSLDGVELKASGGGDVSLHGSAELARSLSEATLIDQCRLLVVPVLIGAGKGLGSRTDKEKQSLHLRESKAYPNGVLRLTYRGCP